MVTLEKVKIKKYKGFKNFTVDFIDENILVGKNNAGKSTIGEVIRLISLATSTYKNAKYIYKPDWLKKEILQERGFIPSKKRTDIILNNPIYQFEDDVASIEAFFSNNTSLKIFINNNSDIFVKVFHEKKCIGTNNAAKKIEIPLVKSMPSLKPLLEFEKLHDIKYISSPYNEKNLSIHFRNKLLLLKEDTIAYSNFCEEINSSWYGVNISNLYKYDSEHGMLINLDVRDEDFVSEISNFGSGLQIWLQIIYFICSTSNNVIVFFDEPDVYLHADLQKKLYGLIKNKFEQFIIATHSVEIICEANTNSIIEINKRKNASERILELDQLQNVIKNLGSYANIKVQMMLETKKIIYLEGKEMPWLKKVASRIFNLPYDSFNIPYEKSGGRKVIEYKLQSLQCEIDDMKKIGISCYFLVDNDYNGKEKNSKIEELAKNVGVKLHIWKRKEIENYFYDPEIIYSVISKEEKEISKKEIYDIVLKVTDKMKQDYLLTTMDEEHKKNKGKEGSTIYKEIEQNINQNWDDINFRLKILSGKAIMSNINKELKDKYNISLSIDKIINRMDLKYLDKEFIDYVSKLFR